MKFPRKNRLQETVELNITAFLNLMVILVPFLLITAVFSRITVLELNLPALDAKADANEPVDLQLQLLVRPEVLEVADENIGLIRSIPSNGGQRDWRQLNDVLLEVKRRFPEEDEITILLEKTTSYQTMIEVMDRIAATDILVAGTLETVSLFPNIALGDAPEHNMSGIPSAARSGDIVVETQGAR